MLIHDIVEIGAGDTYIYDREKNRDKGKRERLAADRFQPLLHNYETKGKSWNDHRIKRGQVMEKNRAIQAISACLWNYAKRLIDDAVKRGYLEK